MSHDAMFNGEDPDRRGSSSGREQHRLRTWNRKLHYYLGLYLLLFLWLFSISGLILNHPKWSTGQFWSQRTETVAERSIRLPTAASDDGIAADLMRQMAITGEVSDLQRDSAGKFNFQVVKPGNVFRVAADLSVGIASVTTIEINAWGAIDALHKFTGVRMDRPNEQRDWLLTRLWSIAMDALALGLAILVASGVYLWWRLEKKRIGGAVAFTLGVVCCGYFLFGFGLVG